MRNIYDPILDITRATRNIHTVRDKIMISSKYNHKIVLHCFHLNSFPELALFLYTANYHNIPTCIQHIF